MPDLSIRPLDAGDAPHVARIFFCAVHEGTRGHYTLEQRIAWGGETIDLEMWRTRLAGLAGFVAERNGEPVGFMTIDASGYVDLAFVLPSVAGTGVGLRLYQAVEARARELGASLLSTQASKVARPFFERQGWVVVTEQTVERRGVTLTNYRMQKAL